jgi:exodeoxyribonuclease VII large subunit
MNTNESSNNTQEYPIYRLSDITTKIKASLLGLTRNKFWVKAHMLTDRGGLRAGHYYCELIDTDDRGNQLAKIRATIWRSNYSYIIEKLKEAGLPDALKANSEICVLCSVRYHELYGLSLDIVDVDTNFGESQINRNRRLIIEQLTKEGILKDNTKRPLPAVIQRIGLITSKDSASYNDFIKTLFNYGFSSRVILTDCMMQGVKTEGDIAAALQSLIKAKADVICIVRGGGSQTDLAWFDNEKIARAIITSPIPVWVGIGHEVDSGVLDVVAHTSFKTPTAVAEALVIRWRELYTRIMIAHERLKNSTERLMALAEASLQRDVQGAMNGLRKHYNLAHERFEKELALASARFISNVSDKVSRLQYTGINLQRKFDAFIGDKTARLDNKPVLLRSTCGRFESAGERKLTDKVGVVKQSIQNMLRSKRNEHAGRSNRIQVARYLKILSDKKTALNNLITRMDSLKPENILRKGYTITTNLLGDIIISINQLQDGEIIKTAYTDGFTESAIKRVVKESKQ